MTIDPAVQALLDAGALTIDELAASAWAAIEQQLRMGFEPWARARGDADEAQIERAKVQLERMLRASKAEFLRPHSLRVQ